MDAMKYNDLRDFLTLLEQQGELKRITLPVDPHLEITEIADRTLRAGGPALLFENPKGYSMPVLCNLFGTPKRVQLSFSMVISIWRIFICLPGSVWRALVLNKFSAATVVHIRKMRLSSLIVATRPPGVWQVSFG